jgi:hypothetical protein
MNMNLRKANIVLMVLLGVVLSGCVLSLHPLFTGGDRIHEPALDGVWQAKDGKGTFTLRWFRDGKSYLLQTELEDQPKGDFNAALGAIGKDRFLEIVPRRPNNIHAKSFYGGHFIQAFSFWKVALEKDTLTLTPLNYQWIEAMDKAKKLDIKHEQQEGGFIMLTASTEELKAFVLKYADDKSAFSGGLNFERKK